MDRGDWLGLKTGNEQNFSIAEKVTHHCVNQPDDAALDIAG
ncbi:hypothetical protein [Acinetobacter calcoaceticus]|nr:hypothetical protein [Acinetobacter calcoaceticus]